MNITTEQIQNLRKETGAGMMDAKKVLVEAEGDFDTAVELLRKRGQKVAAKKAEREAKEGLIGTYLHSNGKVGVVVEVNCETDFVARNEQFKELVHDLSLHIAAASPLYVSEQDVPEDVIAKEKEIYTAQLAQEKVPKKMHTKVIEGKLKKFYSEVCLLNQPFLKDQDKTINDVVTEAISKIGEKIVVKRFSRLAI
ncbi:MAG: translation elongation factor Ts [Patescibacteria group bacterium]